MANQPKTTKKYQIEHFITKYGEPTWEPVPANPTEDIEALKKTISGYRRLWPDSEYRIVELITTSRIIDF